MKSLILNAAGSDPSPVNRMVQRLSDILEYQLGQDHCQTETISLWERNIRHCLGCFSCWVKTPGRCIVEDDGRDIAAKAVRSDILAAVTPVVFGGYGYELKKALDRMIPTILPLFTLVQNEIHHKPRYNQYPSWLILGVQESPDDKERAVFQTLVHRNALNVYCPSFASAVFTPGEEDSSLESKIRSLIQALEAQA